MSLLEAILVGVVVSLAVMGLALAVFILIVVRRIARDRPEPQEEDWSVRR